MKYLILGGGPAGLTAGYSLMKCQCDSFLILEAEKQAGGLCRSVTASDIQRRRSFFRCTPSPCEQAFV